MSTITLPYKRHLRREARAESAFRVLTMVSAGLVLLVLAGVMVALLYGAWPALSTFKFGFLTRSVWNPVTDRNSARWQPCTAP